MKNLLDFVALVVVVGVALVIVAMLWGMPLIAFLLILVAAWGFARLMTRLTP